MDGVDDADAFFDGALEGFATENEAHTASAFVDDSGLGGFGEVIAARGAAGVDEASAAHVAVGDLVAAEVDRMWGSKIGVNFFMSFAEFEGIEARGVDFWEFLFDDIGLDGAAEVIGLAGEVGGDVVIVFAGFESGIAGIAPEDGGHAEFVRVFEGFGDLLELAGGLI